MTAECRNCQEEFMDVNFVDQRLKTRFFKIMDAFAASPEKSTWAATGSRSSANAAHRFFSNRDVSKDELLDSISRATVEMDRWIFLLSDKFYNMGILQIFLLIILSNDLHKSSVCEDIVYSLKAV